MNWSAFFGLIGGISLFVAMITAMEYSIKRWPTKAHLRWLQVLFIIGVICVALAAGLGTKQ